MSKTGGRMPRPDGSAGLHMAVYGVMVASFLIMMLAYFIMFWTVPEAVFMVTISAGFLCIYVCLPMVMLRFEFSKQQSLGAFIQQPFMISTGRISGGDAWLQICLIPLMLALAAIGLCLVIFILRP